MVTLPGVPSLTQEQLEILETCPPPNPAGPSSRGKLIRITAAAGAGKTTTLLALGIKAVEKGHQHISYLTFAKAAADDGRQRLMEALSNSSANVQLDARTLHSCAYRQVRDHLNDKVEEDQDPRPLWFETDIRKWVALECRSEIESFLRPCYSEIAGTSQTVQAKREREQFAREKVEYFIFKSLVHFCQSNFTLFEYERGTPIGRDYYPVKKYHQSGGDGEKNGFSPHIYHEKLFFYAKQAAWLWKKVVSDDLRSFDLDMKRAQLLNLRVPGSILLVDECQDMDACQIDWVAKQQIPFGTIVYIVGDPAQAIYSFRGARPRFLMELKSDIDKKLTESWRFGIEIARIANLVLFAKEKSDQTSSDSKGDPTNWIPYRVQIPPNTEKRSRVLVGSQLQNWRTAKVTLIGRTNAVLLREALGVLGFVEKDQSDTDNASSESMILPDPANLPKIHINGRGEAAGLRLWKRTLNYIEAVFALYKLSLEANEARMQLDKNMFPEFAMKQVSWHSFVDEVKAKELSSYNNVVMVVASFGKNTLHAMDVFRQLVIERKYSAEEADIILTTCHSAKGMEWDNVQVCNDFVDLCNFKKDDRKHPSNSSPVRPKIRRLNDLWVFYFPSWGDDINLIYVACTRARCTLAIPPLVLKVLTTFDAVHACRTSTMEGIPLQSTALHLNGHEGLLTNADAESFFLSLVAPLRCEYFLFGEQRLYEELIDREDHAEFGQMPQETGNEIYDEEEVRQHRPAVVTQESP